LLESLGKTVKCCLILSNIGRISTTFVKMDKSWENYFAIFNESSQYSTKTFGFYKILYRIASFMTEISCFTRISQILTCNCLKGKVLSGYFVLIVQRPSPPLLVENRNDAKSSGEKNSRQVLRKEIFLSFRCNNFLWFCWNCSLNFPICNIWR